MVDRLASRDFEPQIEVILFGPRLVLVGCPAWTRRLTRCYKLTINIWPIRFLSRQLPAGLELWLQREEDIGDMRQTIPLTSNFRSDWWTFGNPVLRYQSIVTLICQPNSY